MWRAGRIEKGKKMGEMSLYEADNEEDSEEDISSEEEEDHSDGDIVLGAWLSSSIQPINRVQSVTIWSSLFFVVVVLVFYKLPPI